MKKRIVSLLCVLLCLTLAFSVALADITFGEDGSLSFGGSAVSLAAITDAVAEELGVTSGDVTWTVAQEGGMTAACTVSVGSGSGDIGTPDTAASATAEMGGKTVVVLLKGAACPVEGTPSSTLALATDVAVQIFDGADEAQPEATQVPLCGNGNHHYIWVDAEYPTCTEGGWRELKCDKCGYERTETPQPKGHSLAWHDGKAATCTATGYDAYLYCTRCGGIFSSPATLPIIAHNYVNGVCSVCGATQPTK